MDGTIRSLPSSSIATSATESAFIFQSNSIRSPTRISEALAGLDFFQWQDGDGGGWLSMEEAGSWRAGFPDIIVSSIREFLIVRVSVLMVHPPMVAVAVSLQGPGWLRVLTQRRK